MVKIVFIQEIAQIVSYFKISKTYPHISGSHIQKWIPNFEDSMKKKYFVKRFVFKNLIEPYKIEKTFKCKYHLQ